MNLPSTLKDKTEWTFIGPMGPEVPEFLTIHPNICVDGGAHFVKEMDIWVGDADSYKLPVVSKHEFKHPKVKDKSDLALALELFSLQKVYKFHFWGFTGGRKDHELFNLGEALAFLNHHPESQILFYDFRGHTSFHLLGEGHWKFHHQGFFSLGTLKNAQVKLKGMCSYPILKTTTLTPLSSLGLSNEGFGDIQIENSGPVFLYYPGKDS